MFLCRPDQGKYHMVQFPQVEPVHKSTFSSFRDRSKFIGYLGWVLGIICLKKCLSLLFFSKLSFCPPFFLQKVPTPPKFFFDACWWYQPECPINFDLPLYFINDHPQSKPGCKITTYLIIFEYYFNNFKSFCRPEEGEIHLYTFAG